MYYNFDWLDILQIWQENPSSPLLVKLWYCINPFIHPGHPFIHTFIHSSFLAINSSILSIHSSISLFIHPSWPSIHSYIYSFIHPSHPFLHPGHPFIYTFIHSSILAIHSSILAIHSSIYQYIHQSSPSRPATNPIISITYSFTTSRICLPIHHVIFLSLKK